MNKTLKVANRGAMGKIGKQAGFSLLMILAVLAALAILAAVAYNVMKPGPGVDTSAAQAKADATALLNAAGNASSAAGNLVGTGATFAIFGVGTSNGASIYTLGSTNSGASAIASANLSTNNVVSSMPAGVTAKFTVPLANGAVFMYTNPAVASVTCDQFNLALRGSSTELIDSTLSAAPSSETPTTGVVAYTVPAGFTTAAAAGDGCYKAAAGGVGAVVAKIM